MKKKTTFGGFSNIEEEIAYNKAVTAGIEAEGSSGSSKKISVFNRFAHDRRGEMEEGVVWNGVIVVAACCVVAMPILYPLSYVSEYRTAQLNEFINEQEDRFRIKLDNGNVLIIDNASFSSKEDGSHQLVANCTESTENGDVLRMFTIDLTKEQYNDIMEAESNFKKAKKSYNITKRTLNKNKAAVEEYFNDIKEAVSSVNEDQVKVWECKIPTLSNNI